MANLVRSGTKQPQSLSISAVDKARLLEFCKKTDMLGFTADIRFFFMSIVSILFLFTLPVLRIHIPSYFI